MRAPVVCTLPWGYIEYKPFHTCIFRQINHRLFLANLVSGVPFTPTPPPLRSLLHFWHFLTFWRNVYTAYMKLQHWRDGGEQIYQLCGSWDKDVIWQNFTHCLKTHTSDQQWVEDALSLRRCASLPNVLSSYIVDDKAYQAVKATKSEPRCIKEMKNQHRSDFYTSESTPTIAKKNKKQSLLNSILRYVLPCCFKAKAEDDEST